MLKTKVTLRQCEKYLQRIATFVCLLGSKSKSKFNFETMKTYNFILIVNQSHYINSLFTLMYFVDQILSKGTPLYCHIYIC